MKIRKGENEIQFGLIETGVVLLLIGTITSKLNYYKGLMVGRRSKKEELLSEIRDELRKENSK